MSTDQTEGRVEDLRTLVEEGVLLSGPEQARLLTEIDRLRAERGGLREALETVGGWDFEGDKTVYGRIGDNDVATGYDLSAQIKQARHFARRTLNQTEGESHE